MYPGPSKNWVENPCSFIRPGDRRERDRRGITDQGGGVQKFSCHYEADLDRGGHSVLDIRPLLWKDGWPVAGDNFRESTYEIRSERSGFGRPSGPVAPVPAGNSPMCPRTGRSATSTFASATTCSGPTRSGPLHQSPTRAAIPVLHHAQVDAKLQRTPGPDRGGTEYADALKVRFQERQGALDL